MKLRVSWWITFFGLFLLVSNSQSQNSPGAWGIDIDTEHNDFLEEEGSGKHNIKKEPITDDEDLLEVASGEGSGSGETEKQYTTKAPTTKKMTACEQLRSSTKGFSSGTYYIPKCTSTGEYEKQQCEGKPGFQKCWCVNREGVEIIGTQMIEPQKPDCIHGKNLKPCVYQLVLSKGLLGAFIPRCTIDGDFESIQCHIGKCWCVDERGLERTDRIMDAESAKCYEPTTKQTTAAPVRTFAPETPYPLPPETSKPPHHKEEEDNRPFDKEDPDDGYDVDKTPDIDVNINGGKFDKPEEDDNTNDKSVQLHKKPEAQSTFLKMIESPGILAAVIGGSVVGLLCAILLVMFIVYRMRKKDEGSYPLEEQKYTNYSYMKAPDKEFYA